MKWDTIKERVGAEIFTAIRESRINTITSTILIDMVNSNFEALRGRRIHEVPELYAEKAYDIVMNWDIRCVGRLRELFPWAFPPSLSKGDLIAYQVDNGNSDWVVERKA